MAEQQATEQAEAILQANRRATAVVGVALVIASIVAITWGTDWFNSTRAVQPGYEDAARAPLVVFAMCIVSAVVAAINFVRVSVGAHAFELELSPELDDWIWGVVAILAAWLVGTTIFT